jgi:hypothetical protein
MMRLSRGVLIALALGALNAAARPQWSFTFGRKYPLEEHSSSNSNPEPTSSAVQAPRNPPSWTINLFKGWYGSSGQGASSQLDTQEPSVTSNAPRIYTSAPNNGDNKPYGSGIPRAPGSSRSEGPGDSHQFASTTFRDGESPRSSSEKKA